MEKERKELIPEVFHSVNSNTISLKNLYLKCATNHCLLLVGKLKRFHGVQ